VNGPRRRGRKGALFMPVDGSRLLSWKGGEIPWRMGMTLEAGRKGGGDLCSRGRKQIPAARNRGPRNSRRRFCGDARKEKRTKRENQHELKNDKKDSEKQTG